MGHRRKLRRRCRSGGRGHHWKTRRWRLSRPWRLGCARRRLHGGRYRLRRRWRSFSRGSGGGSRCRRDDPGAGRNSPRHGLLHKEGRRRTGGLRLELEFRGLRRGSRRFRGGWIRDEEDGGRGLGRRYDRSGGLRLGRNRRRDRGCRGCRIHHRRRHGGRGRRGCNGALRRGGTLGGLGLSGSRRDTRLRRQPRFQADARWGLTGRRRLRRGGRRRRNSLSRRGWGDRGRRRWSPRFLRRAQSGFQTKRGRRRRGLVAHAEPSKPVFASSAKPKSR